MSSLFALIRSSLGVAQPVSRAIAKERLSVMLVHQRNSDVFQSIDMEALRKEVALVIRKYIKVAEDKNASKMTIKQEGEFDFLEMHFQLDNNSLNKMQLAGGKR